MSTSRMKTLTMKFGGTSVGSIEAIERLLHIIRKAREEAEQVAIVVSAMNGVTDLLLSGMLAAEKGDVSSLATIEKTLRERHIGVLQMLAPGEFKGVIAEIEALIADYVSFCEGVKVLGEAIPRALDYTMGLGERMSARQVAAVLRTAGVPALAFDSHHLIVTDDHFQDAAPYIDETRSKIEALVVPTLQEGKVAVITGFIGATRNGIVTTLGRGGSDYSGAIIAASLASDELWIWTDVNGVMSADPRIVPDARTIKSLIYREVAELAYYGAKVVHPKTIQPLRDIGMPLRVKNTFEPDHPGTLILPNDRLTDQPLKAVTAIKNISTFTVEGRGMQGVTGVAGRTFTAVARAGANILVITQSSSEQAIFFVTPQSHAGAVVEEVENEFALEISRQMIDGINRRDEYAIVTVVGSGMRDTPGIASRVLSATARAGVNVVAIAQGSSDCSISLAVLESEADTAIRSIHEHAILIEG